MKAKDMIKNHYYLVTGIYSIPNKKLIIKFLGMHENSISYSLESDYRFGYPHNGITGDNNFGREHYCVYTDAPKVIKELTPEEVMIERL